MFTKRYNYLHKRRCDVSIYRAIQYTQTSRVSDIVYIYENKKPHIKSIYGYISVQLIKSLHNK